MDMALIQTLNAFLLAAVVLAVPVLVTLGIWAAAVDRRRAAPAVREAQALARPVSQS